MVERPVFYGPEHAVTHHSSGSFPRPITYRNYAKITSSNGNKKKKKTWENLEQNLTNYTGCFFNFCTTFYLITLKPLTALLRRLAQSN